MLTVRDLLQDLDVRLLAGERSLHLPVRWVHISELLDPTPWLSGGELLLTTGMQLDTPAHQREFASRLADHHLAGLGFGTGFMHESVLENVRSNEGTFRSMLEGLRDLPIVGDVRGAGFFHAIELVKDKETKESFDDDESETLLRGFLSVELFRRGLICRADDRGDPVIQLSPPLIAGPEQFDEIETILRDVLTEAGNRMHVHEGARRYSALEETRRG